MAKFLGVISTHYQHPSDNLVIEFTDLDLLVNFLYHETQNLCYEFQRKSEVITEQEINLSQNLNKLNDIYETERLMLNKTLGIEQELENVGFCLKNMEKSIDCFETLSTNLFACKCSSNPERSLTLQKLIQLSEDCLKIEEQMVQVKNEENLACVDNPCDLTKNLLLFLDLHTRTLENIEQKSDKLTDQLQQVDGLFQNAYKRSIGACYHKPKDDLTSSFC